jgi:Zn-dependent protease with chaperone function
LANPIPMFVLGVVEFTNAPRTAILLFFGSILMSRVVQIKISDVTGMQLNAVTTGELRDRAFAIAQKAGTKLNQLYVFPAERSRLANAFAHSASNVFLTDYLVRNLNKREVDAIIGHEVTHLQKNDQRLRAYVIVAAGAVVGFAAVANISWIPNWFPLGPAAYALVLFLFLIFSRRNEFAADAGALKLTGDPAAMITGLARITRLNTMPLQWGKLDEKVLTHPSTLRRMAHLARIGGIPESRLPELMAESEAAPTDIYAIPESALRSGKIFSTRFKAQLSWKYSWIRLFVLAGVPCAIAAFIGAVDFTGTARSWALAVGIVAAIAASLALANFYPMAGMRKLERLLRAKLRTNGAIESVRGGVFVSLSPDSSPRVYEGNWSWDIGILTLLGDRLQYRGEESSFVLPRNQITKIGLGAGPVGWFKTQSLYVEWRDAAAAEHVFNLRATGVSSMRSMERQTIRLATDLQNWHSGGSSQFLSPGLAVEREEWPEAGVLGPPVFGEVSSISTGAYRGGGLIRAYIFDIVVAVALAILFGLWTPDYLDTLGTAMQQARAAAGGEALLYVVIATLITELFMRWPYWKADRKIPRQNVKAP